MFTPIEDSHIYCSKAPGHLHFDDDRLLHSAEIYVLSGFSGAGKGTLCKRLTNTVVNKKPVAIIRSVTSRSPRSENEHYTFVTREVFTELIAQHRLLEYNNDYNEAGYGTPTWEVLKAIQEGKTPLLEIDQTGLRRLLIEGKISSTLIKSVFIAAPAKEVAKRLYLRGTDSEEAIIGRLKTAINESTGLGLYDAVIMNQDIDQAVADTVMAFEGFPAGTSFDCNVFQSEIRDILSNWNIWVAKWKKETKGGNASRRNMHAN